VTQAGGGLRFSPRDAVAAALLSATVLALTVTLPTIINDWGYHVEGGRALLSSNGLRVYADHPDIQIGPLALAVSGLVDAVAGTSGSALIRVVIAVVFGPLIVGAVRVASHRGLTELRWRVLMGWCAFAGVGWTALASSRHLDDAMATALIVGGLAAAVAARPVWSGALLALAVWSKPWAVITTPTLLANGPRWSKAVRACALGLVPLAVFVIAAPDALRATEVQFLIDEGSPLLLLADTPPSWLRLAQLAFALAIGGVIARWSPFAAPVAAVAARLLIDPGVWAYYYGPLLLLAVLADASWKRAWPLVTPIAFLGLLDPWSTPASRAIALSAVVVAAGACAWWDRRAADTQPAPASAAAP
jgi:hypothetical protein